MQLCFIPECFCYRLPPLSSSKGYLSSEWGGYIFSGSLKITQSLKDDGLSIVISDSETGEIFGITPYTDSSCVLPCSDSSRYFAIKLVSDQGQKAWIGLGFSEKSDAFDFIATLQDAVRKLKKSKPITTPIQIGIQNQIWVTNQEDEFGDFISSNGKNS